MKKIEKEFNALTGEETITERDETAIEIAEREADELKIAQAQAEAELVQAEAEAQATAKAALLARLGITADEAKLLLA